MSHNSGCKPYVVAHCQWGLSKYNIVNGIKLWFSLFLQLQYSCARLQHVTQHIVHATIGKYVILT